MLLVVLVLLLQHVCHAFSSADVAGCIRGFFWGADGQAPPSPGNFGLLCRLTRHRAGVGGCRYCGGGNCYGHHIIGNAAAIVFPGKYSRKLTVAISSLTILNFGPLSLAPTVVTTVVTACFDRLSSNVVWIN